MGSSSKRKSSRKKSSKLSSQARRMKKSRRNKSKKLGRRHDSMSSHSVSSPGNDSSSLHSDDDSMSSASISTSSSEGTYRRWKNGSRLRGNLKKTRKQAQRRSSSRKQKSSEDLPRTKKRKRSKKNGDSKSRKKYSRKKLRRDADISSASSDSRSCSTCKGGSSSDGEESKRERVRSRSRENKSDKRDSRKEKLGTKRSNLRSPSYSSYSRSRDQSCSVGRSEEKFTGEAISRRLRSVITFPEQPENNKLETYLQTEEIVYDHDDFPSRSSSGGGNNKESTPHSPIAFDGEKRVENDEFVSNHGINEPSESGKGSHEQYHVPDPLSNEVEKNNSAKESRSDIQLPDAGSGSGDLEAILRQKALENLKKFRGRVEISVNPAAGQKNKDKQVIQSRLAKQVHSTEIGRDISHEGYSEKFSEIVKQNTHHQPDGLAFSGNAKKEGHITRHPAVGKSAVGNSSFRERSSGMGSTLKETVTSVASPDINLMEAEKNERKTVPKITQPVSPCNSTDQGTACSSASIEPASCSTSGAERLNNQQDEAKDGSQYEQKTMSVMRGGEMVQVNYKVYIPKRANALARRQLKR